MGNLDRDTHCFVKVRLNDDVMILDPLTEDFFNILWFKTLGANDDWLGDNSVDEAHSQRGYQFFDVCDTTVAVDKDHSYCFIFIDYMEQRVDLLMNSCTSQVWEVRWCATCFDDGVVGGHAEASTVTDHSNVTVEIFELNLEIISNPLT